MVDGGAPLATAHLSVHYVPGTESLREKIRSAPPVRKRRLARSTIRNRATRSNRALAIDHLRATGLMLDAASLIKAIGADPKDRRRLKSALKRACASGVIQRKGHRFFT